MVVAAAVASAAGGAAAPAAAAREALSGTATFALPSGTKPLYIFPDWGCGEGGNTSGFFMSLMWRPLYWEGHLTNDSSTVDPGLSLADLPTWSNGGRTATIRLKHYQWSDGQPVTARDVEFWLNLLRANPTSWCGYAPGGWLDDITRVQSSGPANLTVTFNRRYNSDWLLNNALVQLFPIPQHSWDRTSAAGPIGNYDETTAGARAVYKFLNAQSLKLSTWDTNSLWQVVDGPFRIEPDAGFQPTTGFATLVPNLSYSGSPRPRVARVEEVPFTSDTAELNALLAGRIDYGYLPYTDLNVQPRLRAAGYRITQWPSDGFSDISFMYHIPAVDRLASQLYIRQALQSLIDQSAYIKHFFGGFALPTYGMVPLQPAVYTTAYERSDPYAYDPGRARTLLTEHGWHVVPNGSSTCRSPGVGPHDCGAGIAAGSTIALSLLYLGGVTAFAQEMEAFQSAAAGVGIHLTPETGTVGEIGGAKYGCIAARSQCHWDLVFYPSPSWGLYLDTYPSGASFLSSEGATAPWAQPFFRTAYTMATAAHTSSISALFRVENYVARELPLLWLPNPDFEISVISRHLKGVLAANPLQLINPESWDLRA